MLYTGTRVQTHKLTASKA